MGRNPRANAGMNGTSPEIPFTVDADPDTTPGKAGAAARQAGWGRRALIQVIAFRTGATAGRVVGDMANL